MMKPLLSVIIANVSGMPEIGWCLTALEKQQADEGIIEVIVVERDGAEAAQTLMEQFPWVHLLSLKGHFPIPEMREAGLECSQGEIVAILEDHEIVPAGWCQDVLAAHQAHPQVAAIAGPIENGCTAGITDWAAFFCEYCAFMSPVPTGFTRAIPGNNVAYKRWAVDASRAEDRKSGFWETTLHPMLLQRGYQFRIESGMAVSHKKHFGIWEYIRQRYYYSRYYASLITQRRGQSFRFVRSVACVLLPALLMQRILSCGFSKGRFLKELLLSVPLLLVFTTVWAIGEMAGYLLGAGQSLSLIE
jgi:hypothetical protein